MRSSIFALPLVVLAGCSCDCEPFYEAETRLPANSQAVLAWASYDGPKVAAVGDVDVPLGTVVTVDDDNFGGTPGRDVMVRTTAMIDGSPKTVYGLVRRWQLRPLSKTDASESVPSP